jgi:hypothetical protein
VFPSLVTFAALAALNSATAGIEIDGVLTEAQWAQATQITDFALTLPFNRTPARLPTVVKVLALPEGLAIGFVCEQPDADSRSADARARDAQPNSDAVSAIIDFDGNRNRAYEFTVSAGGAQRDGIWSGENTFSTDWDGVWQSAVASTSSGWTVELLIPWSSVPMQGTRSEKRAIGVNFVRELWNSGERYSYPAISEQQSRYLSDFAELSIASFQQSALSVVPYTSTTYDFVDHRMRTRTGADVSWRPSGAFALTAAVRPDFGQVESDQLVVNFDAVEVAFSDKRPFFTENQAFFDVRDKNFNQLIYTRRVGAQSELDGAIKAIGSTQRFEYGAFAASESETGGKDFLAARASLPGQVFSAGYVLTKVTDRFGLDALVQGMDFKVRAGEQHSFDALLVASDRESVLGITETKSQDFGGTASWGYTSKAWDFGSVLSHYGRKLNFNDFGYLAMADFNIINVGSTWRPQTVRPDGAAISYSFQYNANANDRGDRLSDNVFAYRQFNGANGGFASTQVLWNAAGFDNLISRGNGLVRLPSRLRLSHFYQGPQLGKWRASGSVANLDEGLGERAWNVATSLSYQANPTLALDGSLRWRRSPDWLVWRGADALPSGRILGLFARYNRTQLVSSVNANWIPSPKHELRLKLQSLVISAGNARAVRIAPSGLLTPSDAIIAPLQVRNLGVQLRYKYEFAPLRELYIVYARGGFEQEREDTRSALELFQESFELRDSDQFLVKLRWGI